MPLGHTHTKSFGVGDRAGSPGIQAPSTLPHGILAQLNVLCLGRFRPSRSHQRRCGVEMGSHGISHPIRVLSATACHPSTMEIQTRKINRTRCVYTALVPFRELFLYKSSIIEEPVQDRYLRWAFMAAHSFHHLVVKLDLIDLI